LHNTHVIDELLTLQILQPISAQDYWKDPPTSIEPKVAILLHTYKEVFSVPSGLPPQRAQNHSIIQGSSPVKGHT